LRLAQPVHYLLVYYFFYHIELTPRGGTCAQETILTVQNPFHGRQIS